MRIGVCCALVTGVLLSIRPEEAPLPEAVATYLSNRTQISASERRGLIGGLPVARLLEDADGSREVAVFGAIWIKASPEHYVEQLQDIEQFESGDAFRVTRRISDPPQLSDFSQLDLSDEDIADLKKCRIGSCEVKLGAEAMQKLQSEVNWNAPSAREDVVSLFRRMALEYVDGYREGGNARLAAYRDRDHPTFVADEFRTMIERLPSFAALPDLRRYLLDYPAATLDNATDFLYWQDAAFGLKPTIRINHVVIQHRLESIVVASKMLYASHYFWTALELRVLVPDPDRGPGFWFITINRGRADGLSGFGGWLIRGHVRDEATKTALAALVATKAKLESPAR